MRHLAAIGRKETERLNSLDARFRPIADEVLRVLDDALAGKGYHLIVAEGRRDAQRQLALWSQGRVLKEGTWIVTDPRSIVTKAPPGSSPHEYGLALDVLLYPDGGWPGAGVPLKAEHPGWVIFGDVVRATKDASWGGDFPGWKDRPHFQHRDWKKLRKAGT